MRIILWFMIMTTFIASLCVLTFVLDVVKEMKKSKLRKEIEDELNR